MIYIKLFLVFLKIGAVSFGGGYGMISLIREDCLSNGWLTEGELLDFIAVAESTPGPIAINLATFIGASQGGIAGSLCATLGVVLPSFIIILLCAVVMSRVLKYAGVKATLGGIKPAIIGMILATAINLFLVVIFNFKTESNSLAPDWKALFIFAVLVAMYYGYFKIRKKPISPILLILVSAMLGICLF